MGSFTLANINPIDTQIADIEAVIIGLEEDVAEHREAMKETRKIIKDKREEIAKLLGQRKSGQNDLFAKGE